MRIEPTMLQPPGFARGSIFSARPTTTGQAMPVNDG